MAALHKFMTLRTVSVANHNDRMAGCHTLAGIDFSFIDRKATTSFVKIALKSTIKRLLPLRYRQQMRSFLLAQNVGHVSGPKQLQIAPNEAVVTCVVKNGGFYVRDFIEHYTQMGFRHIFFLDNGSSDDTVPIAQQYPNVSVCESPLPIDAHQGLFKAYMAKTYCHGGWCLDADIDEFFDYPSCDRIRLRDFLDYLNKSKSTAVITQLLDMFSDQPLSQLPTTGEGRLQQLYQYYDLSDVTRTAYQGEGMAAKYGSDNVVTSTETALYFGGIRETLYGNNCLLTKHSLFVPVKPLTLFPHVHFMNHARLADVSCVLRHYKLTSTALDIAVQNRDGFVGNSGTYCNFINFLKSHPDYVMKTKTASRLYAVDDLVTNGFLFISDNYRQYVRCTNDRYRSESIVSSCLDS